MAQDIRYYIAIIETHLLKDVPEEFVIAVIQNDQVNVHWDKSKNDKNRQNKGYTLDQAIALLNDPHGLVFEDEIYHEPRFRTIGKTADSNIVSVAWSSVDTGEDLRCVRIIGIRNAEPGEKALYRQRHMTETKDSQTVLLQEADLHDVPEITADAKLVPMHEIWNKLRLRFQQLKTRE